MKRISEKDIQDLKAQKDFGIGEVTYFSLQKLDEKQIIDINNLPFIIRIFLEGAIRNYDGKMITIDDINRIAHWPNDIGESFPYMPARVLLQDLTGVPLLVDLASVREAVSKNSGDPAKINPKIPVDLVIDHSIQVDHYGSSDAFELNLKREFERNEERYNLIKWAQQSFSNMRIIPTDSGICHQVNLEFLASVVDIRKNENDEKIAVVDCCVGTDSHTPMVNGLGVAGFGVGGIEAEAVMLGLPYYMLLPEVIGIKLTGKLSEDTTATDLVLHITELLRKKNLVGKVVEYFGDGIEYLSVPDRATISNMSPEQGITMGIFPVDNQTMSYLKLSGRNLNNVKFVDSYLKEQLMFKSSETTPHYSSIIEINLTEIMPSVAGPLNPEEKIVIKNLKKEVSEVILSHCKEKSRSETTLDIKINGKDEKFSDGDLVIAAITSCTNTSNPSVMIGAGLVAKKAVELGLSVSKKIKTSLAPGSNVVIDYLQKTNLLSFLEALGFYKVGIGCTTCIGNSGPLLKSIETAIIKNDLYVTSVLSGNRNYGGRVHNLTRGNFLTSPMLVVAYAIAGTMKINLEKDPIGYSSKNVPILLKDIWPSQQEIADMINKGVSAEGFQEIYGNIYDGDQNWQSMKVSSSVLYPWNNDSTYIRNPPFFKGFSKTLRDYKNINNARVLLLLGNKISTDQISPAGAIKEDSPAGKYLYDHEIAKTNFNTYGSRRGNDEVMQRGTFANVRVKNLLKQVKGREGWWTYDFLRNEISSVFDTAKNYEQNNIPVIIIGSELYGVGSSRDWAAKGPALLGVKAVLAKSFERIHRSNLVGMGVMPLEFTDGKGWEELGLDGSELFDIIGIENGFSPKQKLKVKVIKEGDIVASIDVILRIDSEIEIDYFKHGGILPYLVRQFI